jgi:hypothetical protein
MGSMGRKAGIPVKFVYSAQPATKAVAIPILDENDNTITLTAYQRLVIDVLSFNTDAAADTGDLAYIIEAAVAPTAVPTKGTVAAFSIAPNLGQQGGVFPAEGYSCAAGNALYLFDLGTTLESTDVSVVGTGRIVETTRGAQAAAGRCLLTPGGVPGQNY